MKIVLLRGEEISHKTLAETLSFPPYYGKNLDALHDCLTEIARDTAVIVQNADRADPRFLAVMRDSAGENHHLKLYLG